MGLFYVGAREGDSNNSFQLRDYFRTDAALYYRQDGFKAAINIRNLLDIDYAAFSYDINNVQRGEPFTITGSVSWKFLKKGYREVMVRGIIEAIATVTS